MKIKIFKHTSGTDAEFEKKIEDWLSAGARKEFVSMAQSYSRSNQLTITIIYRVNGDR